MRADFAGSHCLEHILVNTCWDVVCTDSFKHKGKTDRISEVLAAHPGEADRVLVVTHDLTAPFSVQLVEKIGHVDYILAYAAESHVDRSITDPVPFVMNNVAVTLNTLEYARIVKPSAMILVSTDEVYGPILDDVPFKEWSPIIPSNPYSASKAAAESIGISYWRTYGVPLIIVNAMNLIGERQDAEKYVPKVIRACRDNREVIIHGSERNVGSRHYMHARNFADGILFLLGKRSPLPYHDHVPAFDVESADRPDRFNIAPVDRVDNLTLAKMIAELTGVKLRWRFEGFSRQRPGHDAHYGLDAGKILDMGWSAPVDFHESLELTVKWTLQHPEWLKGVLVSLLTIIPTRHRPEQCARLIESFDKTTDNADLLFVVDPDDDSYDDMDWKGHTVVTLSPRGTMCQKLNFAAARFIDDYDRMVWYADDNEFITPHWDTLMQNTLDDMGGSGWVYSFDKRRTDIPETWMVSTDVVRELGWFANPVLNQYYVADSIAVLAKRSSLLRFCKEAVVEHHHYENDSSVVRDETYAEAEQLFGQADSMNFKAWVVSTQVSATISRLRRKFNPDVKWVREKV